MQQQIYTIYIGIDIFEKISSWLSFHQFYVIWVLYLETNFYGSQMASVWRIHQCPFGEVLHPSCTHAWLPPHGALDTCTVAQVSWRSSLNAICMLTCLILGTSLPGYKISDSSGSGVWKVGWKSWTALSIRCF